VTASDGFNTATDISDAVFTVGNNRPELFILTPSENEFFSGVQQVFFEAFAFDREDGVLSDSNLVWSSDIDGVLGTGAEINFRADQFSEGTHLITVTATDGGVLVSTASIRIVVARQVPTTIADLVVTTEAATDTVAAGPDVTY